MKNKMLRRKDVCTIEDLLNWHMGTEGMGLLFEIGLSSDLLEYLHKETGANIGRIINGLCKIETFAKANGFDEINYDQWGERPLDFDPPPFNRKR